MPGLPPRPEGEDTIPGASDRPRFTWVPGSADTGSVPTVDGVPTPEGDNTPPGLDYQALLEALADSGLLAGCDEDQDTVLADELRAAADGRMDAVEPGRLAALAAEHMPPGPAQAGWLGVAAAAADSLDEGALAGVAIAAQQQASWAQAAGLAAAAQITARAAAADPKIGVEPDGRPSQLCRDAVGQIALALVLTDYSASAQADLAATLTWRLPATGQALAAGVIDLTRAGAIAEATRVLGEQAARAVEAEVLPGAGRLTKADLKDRLRRAVIAVDPEGAEERRKAAERHADVRLYAEEDQTATIVADKQPQIEAAAGFARITALAKARKAAGQPGSLAWHRSQVLLGLLLGTLPPTPPAEGAPPGPFPPDDGGDPDADAPPHGGEAGAGRDPASDGAAPGGDPGDGRDPGPEGGSWDDLPAPRDEDAPEDDGFDGQKDTPAGDDWDPAEEDDNPFGTRPVPEWPALGAIPPALARPAVRPVDGRPVPGLLDLMLPWRTLAGLADAPGTLGRIGPITSSQARRLADAAASDPGAQWRVIVTNSAGQAIAVARIRRQVRRDYVGTRDAPLSRGRPVLARDGPADDRAPPGTGLLGRVTLIISQDIIDASRPAGRGPRGLKPDGRAGPGGSAGTAGGGWCRGSAGRGEPDDRADPGRGSRPAARLAAAALRAASRALDRALAQAEADAAAGGCAHAGESPAYRPPPRLREFVIARDVTCRNPSCRQPAWRADLDHTLPYDQDGRTCDCNLGGGCRKHHILKQNPRWALEQTRPGHFTWTTPGGRTYAVVPDSYAA